jgi:hypothetical protein
LRHGLGDHCVVSPKTEMEIVEACSSGKWDENDLLILRDTPCSSYLRTR